MAITELIKVILLVEFFSIINTPIYFLGIFIVLSCIPLYYLNFKRDNKVFLGDSGIYLLSIILSSSLIYEHNIQKNIIFADEIFFLLLLPGLDLLRLTLKRLLSFKNPFFGDRDHIHHLLINRYSLML